MVRTRVWRNGSLESEGFPLAEVSDHLGQEGTVVWVDFTDPTADDLRQMEEELGVHELASEDALEPGQRPKIDRYRSSLFLVTYDVACTADDEPLDTHEVKAFVTEQALVTLHDGAFSMDDVVRRWDDNDTLADHGVPFLVWGLLDVVTDHATATVEHLEDMVDALEDDLFDEDPRTSKVQRRAFGIRKSLSTIRRLVVPMREVLGQFAHPDDGRDDHRSTMLRTDTMRPYFRDVADHLALVTEQSDSLRDAVSSVMETNLNLQSNRMNLVMKKVTSWAAIIAIPTAITGFFGQNVKFPGESAWSGLAASAVLIVVSSITLYTVFRRRDWL